MPPTIQDVIAHLERSGSEAHKRGEPESAVALYEAAVMLRAVADPEAIRRVLKRGDYSPKLTSMDTEHREAISKGRSRNNALMKAARKAGFKTMLKLREALLTQDYKASGAFLSMVGTGDKPAPESLLTALKKLGVHFEP